MQKTPKSNHIHIGIYGRRNVGKSSLLNAITRQKVSIVSDVAGTTTDPVEKAMEFLPLGPVLFIDTAGIDDTGSLGKLRIDKTKKMLNRTDLGVIVTESNSWGGFEEYILQELNQRKIPIFVVLNKIDLYGENEDLVAKIKKMQIPYLHFSATKNIGINEFRQAILDNAPPHFFTNDFILRDLVSPGEIIIQVMPIDNEAPKGRLLLPQHQAVRDALDGDVIDIVIKESQLKNTLLSLNKKPKLVVTDSSAFEFVARLVPQDILLTGYSILFSRLKGDLKSQVIDTIAIKRLKPYDKVLISEACSHHPIGEDIGRVKIPKWLQKYLGFDLQIDIVQGRDFPENLSTYKLVIHCGACMFNRREMLSRILFCKNAGVPITNYGLLIAYTHNIFDRVLQPFPDVLEAYKDTCK